MENRALGGGEGYGLVWVCRKNGLGGGGGAMD